MMTEVIHTDNLTKRFGTFTAVDHISFDVHHGEVFGFLGANGAGKTTAMRMLCGLSKPTSGTGTVAGYDIARQPEMVKKHIGYMSQKFSLYEDMTVKENLVLFGGIYGMSRKEIAEKTDVLLNELNFSSEKNTMVKELPLGWQQKLDGVWNGYRFDGCCLPRVVGDTAGAVGACLWIGWYFISNTQKMTHLI